MKRKINGLIIILGVLIFIALVSVTLLFSPIVAGTLEKGTQNMLGGVTKIKNYDCSFWTGTLFFQNIEIRNPNSAYKDGFDVMDMGGSSNKELVLQIPQITVDFQPFSLFTDTLIIDNIRVEGAELQYTGNTEGDNIDTITTHINHYFGYDELKKVNVSKIFLEDTEDSMYNIKINKIKFIDCKVIGKSDKLPEKTFEIEIDSTPFENPIEEDNMSFKRVVYGGTSIISKYIKADIASRIDKEKTKKVSKKSFGSFGKSLSGMSSGLGGKKNKGLSSSGVKKEGNSLGIDTKSLKQKSTKGSLF